MASDSLETFSAWRTLYHPELQIKFRDDPASVSASRIFFLSVFFGGEKREILVTFTLDRESQSSVWIAS